MNPKKVVKNEFGEHVIIIDGNARRPKSVFPGEVLKELEDLEAGSRRCYLAGLREAVLGNKE